VITEDELVRIQGELEDAKRIYRQAKTELAAARGKFHSQLVARRTAGETLTIADMRALEDAAIDDVPEIKTAYLRYVLADTARGQKIVAWESAYRRYWDQKSFGEAGKRR